ncbi:MAG TPA: outer membrane beta-barrel protein [Woeseiaceae bacterium]|nr:outer membrane beta-barrel protein [Woeseiaceae bacterium]
MRSALCLCAFVMSFAGVAQAADNGIYLGGGVTRTSIDTGNDFIESAPDFSLDDDDNGFKVIAGMRPFDWLAFEANYVDFGNIEVSSTGASVPGGSFELTGIDAFAVGFLPVTFVDIFGKVGAIRWDSDSAANVGGIDFEDSDSGTDLAYGAGVQARLGSLAARLEYERFEVDNTDEVAMITLGLTYTFL